MQIASQNKIHFVLIIMEDIALEMSDKKQK